MRHLIAAGALSLLAGCTALGTATTPVSPNDVAAVELALTAAETVAKNYTSLPACPLQTPVCADPVTKQSILDKDSAAYAAVVTLRTSSAAGAPAALTAAQVAIGYLRGAVPAQPAK